MAALGDNYFTTVKESKTSKRVECLSYTGPSIGTSPNQIRNQDNGELLIKRLLTMLEKQEKRIKVLE